MSKLLRLMAPVTAVALVFSLLLTGCGGGGATTTSEDTTTATVADSTATADAAKLEEVKLTWYFAGNFPQVDQDLVFAEVNKGIKEKINATVDFKPNTFGDFEQKMQVVIASGEDYDICFTSSWANNYLLNVGKGSFLPIDDLLAKYAPQTHANVPQSMWTAAKVKGKLYAVINQQIAARIPAISVSKALADKYNLDLNAMSGKITAETLNLLEPFAQAVIKDNPKKAAIIECSGEFLGVDLISGLNCPGAVAFADGSMKVINQFESAAFKAFAKTMREWNEKGLLNSKERITKKTDEWSDAKAGKYAVYVGGAYKPGGDIASSSLGGETYIEVPSGTPYLSTGGIIATMQAINRNSKNPERAMMLLELINTDKDLYNTLNFGIKDKHYTIDADGFMIKEGDAAKAYQPDVAWMFATNFLANITKGMPKTVWEDTKKMNAEATPSPMLGFNFDPEKVKGEIGKCASIYDEYWRSIQLGVASEANFNEFLAKIKTAGSDKILAEMQSQVDSWKATK